MSKRTKLASIAARAIANVITGQDDAVAVSPDQELSPEEKALNDRLDDMIRAGDADMARWHPLYTEALDYMYDNQLADTRKEPREGWPRVQLNEIHGTVLQVVALIVQRMAALHCEPWEDMDVESVKIWTDLLRWQWAKGINMPLLLANCVMDGQTAGYYAAQIYVDERAHWDEKSRQWEKKIEAQLLKPGTFGMDPANEETDVNRGDYCYTKRTVRLAWAMTKWPEYAEKIKAAKDKDLHRPGVSPLLEAEPGGMDIGTYAGSAVAANGDAVAGEPGSAAPVSTEGRVAELMKTEPPREAHRRPSWITITTIHFRDYEEEEVTESVPVPIDILIEDGRVVEDPETNKHMLVDEAGVDLGELAEENWPTEEETYTRPLYPNGRMIIRAGLDTVLNDEPEDQVWPDPTWPYVVGILNPTVHNWRGLNGVVMAKGAQDAINECASHEMVFVAKHADPVLVVEDGALSIDPSTGEVEDLEARPGAVWHVNSGRSSGVNTLPAPPLSRGLSDVRKTFTENFRNLIGVQEVTMGKKMTGEQTATEINQLQTNSRLRVGLYMFFLDIFTVKLMEKVSELCQRYLTAGQIVRVVGEKGIPAMATLTPDLFDAQFDISLEITTALPYDRERKKAEMLNLFQMIGVPLLKETLEAYELTNVDEILARNEAWTMVQQMLEQQEAEAKAAESQEGAPPEEEQGVVSEEELPASHPMAQSAA